MATQQKQHSQLMRDTTKPTVEDITDQTQEINTEMTPIKIEATDNSGQAK